MCCIRYLAPKKFFYCIQQWQNLNWRCIEPFSERFHINNVHKSGCACSRPDVELGHWDSPGRHLGGEQRCREHDRGCAHLQLNQRTTKRQEWNTEQRVRYSFLTFLSTSNPPHHCERKSTAMEINSLFHNCALTLIYINDL